MSKLIACFLSVFLFSCNSENESISLANAVQSQELQTFNNNHKLMETAPNTDSTITKAVKPNNFEKIEKNILLGKFDYKKDSNFSIVSSKYSSKTIYLRKEVLQKFDQMYDAALKDGIKLVIISGTRSFKHQKYIWDRKWAKNILKMDSISAVKEIMKYSSMPSTSRHHWGTDIDINSLEPTYFESGIGEKEYDWLSKNAIEFGFCQVYTDFDIDDRTTGYQNEAWHWSYIPKAKIYLKEYNDKISYEDINGFLGSDLAEELNMIDDYVNGISSNCF